MTNTINCLALVQGETSVSRLLNFFLEQEAMIG